ncbi:DUF7687 domain-containing protein [Phytohabitans houttuyneae]|uniref:Uncharacterized protein n=1 Tax=Phytohabitans houttuyneae TaxID=1076126 RepID=A0A6V8KE75_9ACTN|nr:hypothetical protein [Phytohabitans houttuyneae]GFJ80017.1 hypothetical protein Phou_041970 [Phytohabitans houttuyneae]
MRRFEGFAAPAWDDPFWHAVRLLVDTFKTRVPTEAQVLPVVESGQTAETIGIYSYLHRRPFLVKPLVDYLALRMELGDKLLSEMRTEDEAREDFMRLSAAEVQTYGTRMAGHHQSSKVLVATVEALMREVCLSHGMTANVNPQKRATYIADDYLWVSPRRLDGAFPSLVNPYAIWEIKEYWGKTSGGSKMSDAIYECQLVGTELRAFEDKHGIRIEHFVLLDGYEQWSVRRSDLRRAVDLLYSGLIDELIVGHQVIGSWRAIMERLCAI